MKFQGVVVNVADLERSIDFYREVLDFAASNGFAVTGQAKNRLLVQIEGTAAQVNSAFNVQMGEFQHPTEERTFYAPNREPSFALHALIASIDGMNDYYLPRSMSAIAHANLSMANTSGSGPSGSYLGSDMRAAY